MAHPFEVRKEIEVEATPDRVWEAIATGAGMDGWFLGTGNEVEPRLGGRVHVDFGEGGAGESTVTAWEPPRRFAHRGDEAPDGSLHAFEYTIEGRDGGRAFVRLVHSGFLVDDWEAEYDALNEGDFMYLHLMAQYVKHFRGRAATNLAVWREDSTGREAAIGRLQSALGLTGRAANGDRVEFTADGLGSIDGVVDFVSPSILGVRTDDALYRFLHSPQGVVYLGHHIYRDGLDKAATESAWRSWLDRAFSGSGER